MATTQREIAVQVGNAVNSTGMLEVLEARASATKGIVELRCRCIDEAGWMATLKELLLARKGFRIHVCQKYELSEDKKLGRGWYMKIQADELAAGSKRFIDQLLRARACTDAAKETPRKITPVMAGVSKRRAKPVVKTTTAVKKRKARVLQQVKPSGEAAPEIQLPDGGTAKEIKLAWKTHPEQTAEGRKGAVPVTSASRRP